MDIDEKKLEYYSLKNRLSGLVKFLAILNFVIGGLFIITITGSIAGIILIIVGLYLLKLHKELPDIDERTFFFFKNLWIFFIIYTISFILSIIFMIVGAIVFYFWEGFGELFQIF